MQAGSVQLPQNVVRLPSLVYAVPLHVHAEPSTPHEQILHRAASSRFADSQPHSSTLPATEPLSPAKILKRTSEALPTVAAVPAVALFKVAAPAHCPIFAVLTPDALLARHQTKLHPVGVVLQIFAMAGVWACSCAPRSSAPLLTRRLNS